MRQFWSGKGDDSVRAKRAFDGEFARVGIPARRQIDGDYRRSECVDLIAHSRRHATQRRFEAGADDGVEKQIRGTDHTLNFF